MARPMSNSRGVTLGKLAPLLLLLGLISVSYQYYSLRGQYDVLRETTAKTIMTLKSEGALAKDQLDNVRGDLEKVENRRRQVSSEAESCQSAMKQAQQSHDAKLRKASDMESRMKLQLTELQGDLDDEKQACDAASQEHMQELSSVQTAYDETKAELSASVEQAESLQDDLKVATAAKEETAKQLADLEEAHRTLEEHHSELKHECQARHDSCGKLSASLEACNKNLAAKVKELASAMKVAHAAKSESARQDVVRLPVHNDNKRGESMGAHQGHVQRTRPIADAAEQQRQHELLEAAAHAQVPQGAHEADAARRFEDVDGDVAAVQPRKDAGAGALGDTEKQAERDADQHEAMNDDAGLAGDNDAGAAGRNRHGFSPDGEADGRMVDAEQEIHAKANVGAAARGHQNKFADEPGEFDGNSPVDADGEEFGHAALEEDQQGFEHNGMNEALAGQEDSPLVDLDGHMKENEQGGAGEGGDEAGNLLPGKQKDAHEDADGLEEVEEEVEEEGEEEEGDEMHGNGEKQGVLLEKEEEGEPHQGLGEVDEDRFGEEADDAPVDSEEAGEENQFPPRGQQGQHPQDRLGDSLKAEQDALDPFDDGHHAEDNLDLNARRAGGANGRDEEEEEAHNMGEVEEEEDLGVRFDQEEEEGEMAEGGAEENMVEGEEEEEEEEEDEEVHEDY